MINGVLNTLWIPAELENSVCLSDWFNIHLPSCKVCKYRQAEDLVQVTLDTSNLILLPWEWRPTEGELLSSGAMIQYVAKQRPHEQWHVLEYTELNGPTILRQWQSMRCICQTEAVLTQFRGDARSIGVRIRHDLNASLNGLLSLNELAIELVEDEVVRDLLQSAETAASDLVNMIDQFTRIAKFSSQGLTFESIDLHELMLDVQLRTKHLGAYEHVQWQVMPNLPNTMANREALVDVGRVWLNYLEAIAIPQTAICMHVQYDADTWWCDAELDSHLKPLEHGQKHWLAFHELHLSKRNADLRLAFVDRVVELHGGTCQETIQMDGRARFRIQLPFRPNPRRIQ